MVDPSGLSYKYYGCASGKGAQAAKTELEKILSKREQNGITVSEAVNELATIMYTIRDPSKDKPFELEMGWLSALTNWKYASVPQAAVAAADAAAKANVVGGNSSIASVTEAASGSAMET